MNKTKKILLAIFGATDLVMGIITPILVAMLWIKATNYEGLSSYILYAVGLVSSVYRAYKAGFMK